MWYFFIPVSTKPIWWVCCQKAFFFVRFIWPQNLIPFEVSVVTDNWICWSLFLNEWRGFFLKPSQTCGDVGVVWFFFIFFYLFFFLTPRLQFSICDPLRVFGHSNSPPHSALRQYRHTSSSLQIRNIFSWLELLNFCPDGGNGDFQFFSYFLTNLSILWSSTIFCCTSELYSWFYSLWWMIWNYGTMSSS